MNAERIAARVCHVKVLEMLLSHYGIIEISVINENYPRFAGVFSVSRSILGMLTCFRESCNPFHQGEADT